MKTIKDYVWTPHWDYNKVDISRCRYRVAEGGRSVGFNQCTRKPTTEIQGHGFCNQHAEIVNNELGLIKGDKILYFARFSKYNNTTLVRLFILRETNLQYVITGYEDVVGSAYIGDKIRKDGSGHGLSYGDTRGKFFEDEADAHEYIAQCIEQKKINLQKEIESLDGQQEEMAEQFYNKYKRHIDCKGDK